MNSAAIERFIRAGWMQRRLWLEASLYLVTARFLLTCVPFPRWKWMLGTMHPPVTEARIRAIDFRDDGVEARVGRALETATRVLKWESVCLSQAVAAKRMLARRGCVVEIYIGSRRSEQAPEPPALHAWAVVDDLCITGASEVTAFTPMLRYL